MDGRKAVQLPRIDTVEPKLRKIEPTNKDVDRIVMKRLCVLRQTDVAEPIVDIHVQYFQS